MRTRRDSLRPAVHSPPHGRRASRTLPRTGRRCTKLRAAPEAPARTGEGLAEAACPLSSAPLPQPAAAEGMECQSIRMADARTRCLRLVEQGLQSVVIGPVHRLDPAASPSPTVSLRCVDFAAPSDTTRAMEPSPAATRRRARGRRTPAARLRTWLGRARKARGSRRCKHARSGRR